VDIAQGEKVEGELDSLIQRRDTAWRQSEGERRMEELWAESVRRYNASREKDLRAEWRAHYLKMRGVHLGLASEYDRKLKSLENGHETRGEK
jgi:hypothetical protein